MAIPLIAVLLTYLPAHAQPYIAAVLGSWNEWGSFATGEPESMVQ